MTMETYLAHLDAVFSREPKFIRVRDEPPPLYVLEYVDLPSKGSTIGFTAGLGILKSYWPQTPFELMIALDSTDDSWMLALGDLVLRARGRSMFSLGETFDFGEPISPESTMSGFLIHEQLILHEPADSVDLEGQKLTFRQLSPIYHDELIAIRRYGYDWFRAAAPDPMSTTRPSIAIQAR